MINLLVNVKTAVIPYPGHNCRWLWEKFRNAAFLWHHYTSTGTMRMHHISCKYVWPIGRGVIIAVMHLYIFCCCCYCCFCPFLFLYFLKSGIDKLMEWSTIPVCPSLTCSFNRGDTEGTNSSRFFCLMFVYVYVLFYVTLCQDWFCGFFDNLWYDDLRAE